MKNNKFRLSVLAILGALMVGNSVRILNLNSVKDLVDKQEEEIVVLTPAPTYIPTAGVANIISQVYFAKNTNASVPTKKEAEREPETSLPEEDIKLIALVTMAEAESESEYGQRLVIDTILNRMDSLYFPDTIHDVIYQKSQFSSIWNGRVDRCYVKDELCDLVEDELYSRTNHDVMFFTAGNYGHYGKNLFQEGNHYFCGYE